MNIYVGNLPYSLTEDGMRKLFEEYGEVSSAKIISDHATGRSKGFGFVDMSSDEAGQAAIDALNEHEVEGRNLRVNKARPRTERPSRNDS